MTVEIETAKDGKQMRITMKCPTPLVLDDIIRVFTIVIKEFQLEILKPGEEESLNGGYKQ